MSNDAGWLINVRRSQGDQVHDELYIVAIPDLAKALTVAEQVLAFTANEVPESVRSYSQAALDFWEIQPGQVAAVQVAPIR